MKSWFKSKTIWLNVLTLLVTFLGEVTGIITLNAETLKILGVVVLLLNTVLRFITTSAIGTGTTKKP